MATVNVNHRSSPERVYPDDEFANDGAQNERVPNEVLRGVLIGSAPDDSGSFGLDRATRHVGELQTPHFLAATRRGEEPIKVDDHHSPRQVRRLGRPPAIRDPSTISLRRRGGSGSGRTSRRATARRG
jgi:hypothetical protein